MSVPSAQRPFPWRALLLSLPILLFWLFYLNRFVVQNIPRMDDLTLTIDFIEPFEAARTWGEKLRILFAQHIVTEHRLPFPRLLIYAQYRLTGEFDYALMAWYGNLLAFALLGYVLLRVFQRLGRPAWQFLPVAFLLFQTQFYEIFTWSNCSLLYALPTALAWTSFYFASFPEGRSSRLVLSLVAAVLCLGCFGNGMFVFPPLGAILLYQRRYRDFFVALGVGVVGVGLYFIGYHSEYAVQTPTGTLESLLTLFGAYLDPLYRLDPRLLPLLMVLGGVVLLTFVGTLGLLARRWFADFRPAAQPVVGPIQSPVAVFLAAAFLFIVLTGVALVLKRANGNVAEMLVSRYRTIGLFSSVLTYLLWLTYAGKSSGKLGWGAALVGTASLWLLSFWTYHLPIFNSQEAGRVGSFNFQRYGNWHLFPPSNEWNEMVNDATARLLTSGLYRFPPQFFSPYADRLLPDSGAVAPAEARLLIRPGAEFVDVLNEAFRPTTRTTPTRGTVLVLASDSSVFLVPIDRQRNAGKKDLFRTGRVVGNGFGARLVKGVFPAGTYRISLFHRDGDRVERIPTGQVVEL